MDAVIFSSGDGEQIVETFCKTRPDDFIRELKHIASAISGDDRESPLAIERGLDTMMLVSASHLSAQECRPVQIDWTKGYSAEALKSAG